jgi:hypothetical protein
MAIADKIFQRLKKGVNGNLLLLLEYGSGDSDIDLLAIYDTPPFQNEILLGGLDFFAVWQKDLPALCALLDPVVTEPLLTGHAAYGSGAMFQEERAKLLDVHATDDSVVHLLAKSHGAFKAVADSHSRLVAEPSDRVLRLFCKNARWVVSYRAFARYYRRGGAVTTLSDLMKTASPGDSALWDRLSPENMASIASRHEAIMQLADLCLSRP